jgi:hypothetical protein
MRIKKASITPDTYPVDVGASRGLEIANIIAVPILYHLYLIQKYIGTCMGFIRNNLRSIKIL